MCVPKSVLCLVAFGGLISFPLEAESKALAGPLQGRASVIDGDTLEVQGTRIRLFGIDAPESAQTCFDQSDRTYRCGQRAAFALADKVGARPVSCQPTGKDRYDRIVARCSVAGEDRQAWRVRNGHAWAVRRYSKAYRPYEAEAKAAKAGMWAGSFEAPWDWRRDHPRQKR
ncbi:MAG: thermonuclease family protein [Hyphomonadaceae bacterium]